jgi:hypothetical protein
MLGMGLMFLGALAVIFILGIKLAIETHDE